MGQRDRLAMQFADLEPCGNCLGMETERTDAHHSLVREDVRLGNLLYDVHNITFVHHLCHVPESPNLRLHSAVILSARMERLKIGAIGPVELVDWCMKIRGEVPKHLIRVLDAWRFESNVLCPVCHQPTLHYIGQTPPYRVGEFRLRGKPITPNLMAPAIWCWRCFWTNMTGERRSL